jgi:hypothetical protein
MHFYKDTRDASLEPGVYVAYNLSGDVAKGQIVSAGRGGYGPYKVRLLHDAAGFRTGHISNVKRHRSMLVIPEDA